MKQIKFWLAVLLLICMAVPAQAAEPPYLTMTEDHNGDFVFSQVGYLPDLAMYEFDGKPLKRPVDVFVDDEDRLFIADNGNKRIILSTRDGEFIRTYGEGTLKAPMGVYVRHGKLYVADESLKEVVLFDLETGEILSRLGKPTDLLYGQENNFRPQAVAVDKAGSMYVICKGNPNGISQFSADGTFLGYFGANVNTLSAFEMLQRLLFSEEEATRFSKNLSSSPVNLAMDERGMIYTVTGGHKGVKRLSMSGNDTMQPTAQGFVGAVDVAVGEYGNIFVLDQNGYIMEYTRDGRVLFYFAGQDATRTRSGLFVYAMAIDLDSKSYLYVADRDKGVVQRFAITEYAKQVHHALDLYQDGLYEQSREPWEKLLEQNSMFDYAQMGLGRAYFQLGMFEEALTASRLGGDREGYSEAFWEVRNTFLQDNIIWIFVGLAALWLLGKAWKLARRHFAPARALSEGWARFGQLRLMRELRWMGMFLRNPADALYGVKREGRVSVLSTSILYLVFFLIYMINKYTCGYLFKMVPDGYYEVGLDLVLVFGVILLFLVACNLICNIRDGEGTIKQMYCSMAYAFTPYILLKPIAYALSFVLTQNEQFVITLLDVVMLLWCALLVVLMLRYLQEYTMRDTVITILLTAFTMLMLVVAMVIVAVMVGQLGDFITSVWKEARFFYES